MEPVTIESANRDQIAFMHHVYYWMFVGLTLTGVVAYCVSSSDVLRTLIDGNFLIFFPILAVEFLLVWHLSKHVGEMTPDQALTYFLLYSFTTGLTFSIYFLLYTIGSIAQVFLITAGTFGIMSVWGYVTKRDLTGMAALTMMAVFGIILASLINLFFANEAIYWATTYIGVLAFVALTAFDTQKIKEYALVGAGSDDDKKKQAIIGALRLYLDFLNLFIDLLRIFGRRK